MFGENIKGVPLDALRQQVRRTMRSRKQAQQLPSEVYLRSDVFALEQQNIFERDWVCLGHENRCNLPGSYIRGQVGRGQVFAVRGEDLVLRAFHDVCPHRGAEMLDADCGRLRQVVCPYHGFTFGLDGRLVKNPNQSRLTELRVETFHGLVFVSADLASPAASLSAQLEGLEDELTSSHLSRLKRVHEASHLAAANWKLLVENFVESHHFPHVHPMLEARSPTRLARTVRREFTDPPHVGRETGEFTEASQRRGLWLGGTMQLTGETVSVSGALQDRALLDPTKHDKIVRDFFVWPSLLLSVQPDYLLTYRLVPKTPSETEVFFSVYGHPSTPTATTIWNDVIPLWEQINQEDRAICARVQRGMSSVGRVPGSFLAADEDVHAFQKMIGHALFGDKRGTKSSPLAQHTRGKSPAGQPQNDAARLSLSRKRR